MVVARSWLGEGKEGEGSMVAVSFVQEEEVPGQMVAHTYYWTVHLKMAKKVNFTSVFYHS